jgi:hypothetical protein
MAERLKASRLITGVPVNRDVGSATEGRRREGSERAHPTPSFMFDMNENRYHKRTRIIG